MKSINPDISRWIEEYVFPKYDSFDMGHKRDHVHNVIKTALELSQYYDVNHDMVAVAAACHDLGLAVNRKTHHIESGRIIRNIKDLQKWFTAEQIEIIAQATEDHRASSNHEPRTIYGKIVAEADRQIIPEVVIRRAIQYGLNDSTDKESQWQRMVGHLEEKYAEGGYLRLWIPQSSNSAKLNELRTIIKDKKTLREFFDHIYNEELDTLVKTTQ